MSVQQRDNRRPDWWALEQMYRWGGLKLVQQWQKTPLFDLDIEELRSLAKSVFSQDRQGVWEEPPLRHLPFKRFACVVRNPSLAGYVYYAALDCIEERLWDIPGNAEVEAFLMAPEGPALGVATVRVEEVHSDELSARKDLRCYGRKPTVAGWMLTVRSISDEAVARSFRPPRPSLAEETLRQLVACFTELADRHIVEVRAQHPRAPGLATRIKPWLREDLPHLILLDPEKAVREHGHRIERHGGHASPLPHQRRGHWVTLRHPRYGANIGKKVWRRPAWVGDAEWCFRGATYKVTTRELPEGPEASPVAEPLAPVLTKANGEAAE